MKIRMTVVCAHFCIFLLAVAQVPQEESKSTPILASVVRQCEAPFGAGVHRARLGLANGGLFAYPGGRDTVRTVYGATTDAGGDVNGWRLLGSLVPPKCGGVESVVELHGWLYAYIEDPDPDEAGLYYAQLKPDGSIGEWKRAFYQPCLREHGCVLYSSDLMVARGRLYFWASEYSGDKGFMTTVSTDGSPGPWTKLVTNMGLGLYTNGHVYRMGQQTFVAPVGPDGQIGEYQATYGPPSAVAGPVTAWRGHLFAVCADGLYHTQPDSGGQVNRWNRLVQVPKGLADMVATGRRLFMLGSSLYSARILVAGQPDPDSLAVAKPSTPKVVMDDSKLLFGLAPAGSRYDWAWDDTHKRLLKLNRTTGTWEITSLKDTEVYGLCSTAGNVLLALTQGGILRSSDGGTSWLLGEGLPSSCDLRPGDKSYGRTSVSWSDPSVVYLALRNAVYVSSDSGRRWLQRSNGIRVMNDGISCVSIDPRDSRTAYAGVDAVNTRTYVYRTTDGGLHWAPCGTFYEAGERPGQVSPTSSLSGLTVINISITDSSRITAWTKGTCYWEPKSYFVSRDGGHTWLEKDGGQ